MGRKRFKRKHRSKTRRALLIVFLLTFIALGIIGVAARYPTWYWDLLSEHARIAMSNKSVVPGNAGTYEGEWVLPAIVAVVSLSGISSWVILIKANR